MYLDIRFSTRKNGEKIPTAILRKSVRKNGKVTHKDFGYISGLTLNTLYAMRDLIKADHLLALENDCIQTPQDGVISNQKQH